MERGAPPLPALEMIHESPWLNLMLYPAFGTSSNGTPGIWTRDLSGLIN